MTIAMVPSHQMLSENCIHVSVAMIASGKIARCIDAP